MKDIFLPPLPYRRTRIFLIFELILIFSAAKLHHIIETVKKTTKIFSLHFEVSGKISIFVPAKSFF